MKCAGLLLTSLVQGWSRLLIRLVIQLTEGQAGMYSAGPSEPQLREIFREKLREIFHQLEVPEQHHHLEVDLVSPPSNPVDEESTVVPDPQLGAQPAPVTTVLLPQLLEAVGLPGGEVPQQTLAAVLLQVVPQPLRSLVGPGLGRFG